MGIEGIERIQANNERDFVDKAVGFVQGCIMRFQSNHNVGNFVLGLHGSNGRVRRARQTDVFSHLACRSQIDWRRVSIFLVDERYGFQSEEDSNAYLVRDSLLKTLTRCGIAFPDDQFIAPNTALKPMQACAADYQSRLAALFERENWPHLVTIGLGSDMHIASIFPEWYQAAPERWAEATQKGIGVLCTETTTFEVPHRICVNLRVIRKAERIMVTLQEGSEEAWNRVNEAFQEERFSERKAKRARVADPTDVLLTSDGVMLVQVKGPCAKRVAPPPSSPLDYVLKYSHVSVMQLRVDTENHFSLVIMGAGGDLAKKKTFPSIFQLHLGRLLPANTSVIGCEDTKFHSDLGNMDDLWEKRLRSHLECEKGWVPEDLHEFRKRMDFVPVSYNEPSTLQALDRRIRDFAQGRACDNRVFYLALPSFLFGKAVEQLRLNCWSETGSSRVIVEKPFGKNGKEAKELSDCLKQHLLESETFRIDHYLAKTLVLNLLTLRFANRELGHLFHNHHIANVRITFKESIGVQGRAGYFDGYGIIRDIMQNHLMQVLTLIAMEAPASLQAEDVRDEKVKVLKQIRPIDARDCVIGQYDGYQDDPAIRKLNEDKGHPSRCATFAVVVLYLDNERWSGVPLIMKAGKALETQHTIVRLQFKKAPQYSLFGDQPQNELVIRIQPHEAIYYKMLAKLPGLSQGPRDVQQTVLDLDLKKRFELRRTPEAYEKLIHDVIQGESHNFVRRDELEEAWRIFDPLLHKLEVEEQRVPERYVFGSRGPLKADELIDRLGYRRYTVTGVPGFAEDDFD